MRFFTRNACAQSFPSDITEDDLERACDDQDRRYHESESSYKNYLANVQSHWPPDVVQLSKICVHDCYAKTQKEDSGVVVFSFSFLWSKRQTRNELRLVFHEVTEFPDASNIDGSACLVSEVYQLSENVFQFSVLTEASEFSLLFTRVECNPWVKQNGRES